MSSDNKDYIFLLEEYKVLNSRINNYLNLRIVILGITISALGVIYSEAGDKPQLNDIITMFIILDISIILNWSISFQIQKISAYIKIFIERESNHLYWNHIRENVRFPPELLSQTIKKIKLPYGLILQEYPFMYFILGLLLLIYTTVNEFSNVLIYLGYIFLIYHVLVLQYIGTSKFFKKISRDMVIIKESINKKGDLL